MSNACLNAVLVTCTLILAACRGQEAATVETGQPKVDGVSLTYAPGTPELAAIVTDSASDINASPLKLSGRLAWNEEHTVQVFTPFGGRVVSILAQPGDRVKQGTILALVASPEFGQALSDAKRTRTDFNLAEQNVKRARELFQAGVIAHKDLSATEAEFARADAEIRRATARVAVFGSVDASTTQEFPLTSPIEGTVVDRNINPGQELRPDAQVSNLPPSFVVTNPDTLWFVLDLQESDAPFVARGQTITLTSPAIPGGQFKGKVQAVADFLDPATRTIRVRGAIDNRDRRLKAGMFVNAEIERRGASLIQVPSKAVFLVGGKFYVFVEEGNGKFTRTQVTTGTEHTGHIVVLSGLTVGQKVVTDGALLLQQMLKTVSGNS